MQALAAMQGLCLKRVAFSGQHRFYMPNGKKVLVIKDHGQDSHNANTCSIAISQACWPLVAIAKIISMQTLATMQEAMYSTWCGVDMCMKRKPWYWGKRNQQYNNAKRCMYGKLFGCSSLGVWGEVQWKGLFQPKRGHTETIGLDVSGG